MLQAWKGPICMGLWKDFKSACSTKPRKPSKAASQIQNQASLDGDLSSAVSSQSSLPNHASSQPSGVNVEFKTNGLHHARPSSDSIRRSSSLQHRPIQQKVPSPAHRTSMTLPYIHLYTASCFLQLQAKIGLDSLCTSGSKLHGLELTSTVVNCARHAQTFASFGLSTLQYALSQ